MTRRPAPSPPRPAGAALGSDPIVPYVRSAVRTVAMLRVTTTREDGTRTVVTTGTADACLAESARALLLSAGHGAGTLALTVEQIGSSWSVTAEHGAPGPHPRPYPHPPTTRDARALLRRLRCTDLATAPLCLSAALDRAGAPPVTVEGARGALARTCSPIAPERAARALGLEGARGLSLVAALAHGTGHVLTTT